MQCTAHKLQISCRNETTKFTQTNEKDQPQRHGDHLRVQTECPSQKQKFLTKYSHHVFMLHSYLVTVLCCSLTLNKGREEKDY